MPTGSATVTGKKGQAVSLVSEYDVDLVHNIEEYIGAAAGGWLLF